MAMKQSYIFLATGFEEIEALATADVLRRAGINAVLVSIYDTLQVEGAHGIVVNVDCTMSQIDCKDAEWLICPGGLPGADNLVNHAPLAEALKAHAAAGGRIAAICASPAVVLAPLGLLAGRKATCYPGFENALVAGGATPEAARVVVDGNVITGNGPSSSIAFGLAIVEATLGADAAQTVASGMLV